MENKEGLWDFEDEMEDRLIQKQIEDDEQEFHELFADLSEDQKKIYEVLSEGKRFVREHIYLMKNILNGYHYDANGNHAKKYTGEIQ
jgi:methanogenic corrinoid protein MtbC1